MDLHLVKYGGFERPLCGVGTMYQHVPVPGGSLGLRHCADDISHIRPQRIVGHWGPGGSMADYEDADPITFPAPVIALPHGPPTRHDRTVSVFFVYHFSGRPLRMKVLPVPLMQPHEAVAAWVVRCIVGTGDVAVEGHRHGEH